MAAEGNEGKLKGMEAMKANRIMRKFLAIGLLLGACGCGLAQEASKPAGKTVAEKLGYPKDARLLIIHAQDMGLAHSVDKATFEALEKGWVTSGSILVPCPWFPEVAAWARNHPNADLGIRIEMNSVGPAYRWGPISAQKPGSGLVDADGYLPTTQRYVAQHAKMEDVQAEARAQIERARRDGVPITHLDNAMKTMIWTPELFRVYWQLGQEYKVPIVFPSRQVVQKGTLSADGKNYMYGGIQVDIENVPMDGVLEMFAGYTQKDWLSVYEKTLEALPPGVYQLCVHLGYNNEELQAITGKEPNWGAQWRQNDLDVVSSPEFQKFLKDKGFILIGWKDLQKAMPLHP